MQMFGSLQGLQPGSWHWANPVRTPSKHGVVCQGSRQLLPGLLLKMKLDDAGAAADVVIKLNCSELLP